MIEHLLGGFAMLGAWQVILALLVGVALGYFVGALPGLTTSVGMALLLPFTFAMDPIPAMVMLVALYVAGDYAGAIPAILVNAPGQPAAAVTAFDGYPMRKKGQAGKALTLSIVSSGFGGIVAAVLLIITSVFLARVALAFGPAEYFALAVMGLALVTSLSTGSTWKALIGLSIGLLVVTIGLDPMFGVQRYVVTMGVLEGVAFLPALIGLFALSEVFMLLEKGPGTGGQRIRKLPGLWGSIGEVIPHRWTMIRSSLIGYAVGVIPGAGGTIGSLVSYGVAKRMSKDPDSYGTGNPEGVVASETANNAAAPGALAPLLSLGIPGSASSAILIGALMIHGISPGPMLFIRNPEIPYAVFASLLVGLPFMMVVGLLGARLWVQITRMPSTIVATIVAAICLLGSYSTDNSTTSIWITVIAGIAGYGMRKVGIHPAPIVLALVLGNMMESNFRRGLRQSGDSLMYFADKPIALTLLAIAALVFIIPMLQLRKKAEQQVGLAE